MAADTIRQLQERRKVAEIGLESARQGTFITDGYNDTSQSAQGILEVELQLADVRVRLAGTTKQLEASKQDLLKEQKRDQDLSTALIRASISGRVWEIMTAPGEHVNAGQTLMRLLDCSKPIVTASVSEGVFQKLSIGQAATFKPADGGQAVKGWIVDLSGLAAVASNDAIQSRLLSGQPYHVALKFPDLANRAECQISRAGVVTFDTSSSGQCRGSAAWRCAMSAATGWSYWDALLPSAVIIALAVAILPWFSRNNPWLRAGALGICIFLSWRYIIWRLFYTVPPLDEPLNFFIGALFVGVEVLSMVGTTLTELFLTRVRERTSEADRNIPWLSSLTRPPRVDVLICTYNEEEEILETTILGALAIKYANFRVWVCDDGKRQWLKQLCERYGVHYLTRADNGHAKAGNINAALNVLAKLDDRPDFVAILDADFVPMSDFLTRTLALTREPDIGIVQTPQHFFNPDPVQSNLAISRVWPDEQRFFFDTVMASKDAWGVAFCCGTSSVIRFSALERIGGFPTDSVTEDYLLTLRLREIGLRTIYLNEVLSLGLAPEGLKEYYGQRSRWCLGAVQICCGRSGPLNFRNNLPLIDRISLIDTFLFWSASHTMRLLAFLVPALFLLFGVQAVSANVKDAISYVAPFIVAQIGILLWLTEGRIMPIMSDLYGTLCATDVVKAVASGLLRPRGQKFKVTAKGGDRSQRVVQWPVLRIFLFYLTLNVLGIANAFIFQRSAAITDTSMLALFWSWYNIVVLILACYVCIEQPQRRYRHRFPINDSMVIQAGTAVQRFAIRDISVSGARLIGKMTVPIDGAVIATIGDFVMRARVVRVTDDGFALAFDPTLKNRANIVRFIFSKRYLMAGRRVRPTQVAWAIGQRLFR